MLGLHTQHLSTRHQHLKPWAGDQHVYYLYTCGHDLLKVIQYQELLTEEETFQACEERLITGLIRWSSRRTA